MNLIQQETAAKIWQCYREIKTAEKLLKDMEKLQEEYPRDPHAQYLKDAFGHRQNLQLSIPMGDKSHSLFDLSAKLAESVIRAHIAAKRAELIEVNEQARIELEENIASL